MKLSTFRKNRSVKKSEYVAGKLKVQQKENAASFFSPPVSASPFIHSFNNTCQSLPSTTQHFFKAKLGHDFSNVKIHTNKEAETSANDINAKAYTVGEHIVFNRNEYNPHSYEGKKLLAHELAHVMQYQNGAAVQNHIQRQRSTPVPAAAVVDAATNIATFTVNSVNVVVEPDQTVARGTGVTFHGQRYRVNRTGAVTVAYLRPRVTPSYTGSGARRRVSSVTLSFTLYIKTFFGTRASASDSSAYGDRKSVV